SMVGSEPAPAPWVVNAFDKARRSTVALCFSLAAFGGGIGAVWLTKPQTPRAEAANLQLAPFAEAAVAPIPIARVPEPGGANAADGAGPAPPDGPPVASASSSEPRSAAPSARPSAEGRPHRAPRRSSAEAATPSRRPENPYRARLDAL